MKQNNSKEFSLPDITLYIQALQTTYQPASTPAQATHFFTTQEVLEAIKEIEPSIKVTPAQVLTALSAAGFSLCNRPGSQGITFRWMFREK